MNRTIKTFMIFIAIVLCLTILASCKDKDNTSATDSTAVQTTESATAETEEQTSEETKPDGIHAGTDNADGWGEFKPV